MPKGGTPLSVITLEPRFVLKASGWISYENWDASVEILRNILLLGVGITVMVVSQDWDLQNPVVTDASFRHFSRHVYRADSYGNIFTNVTFPRAYPNDTSGVSAMQHDRVYTLIIWLYVYFFVSEILVCMRHFKDNRGTIKFHGVTDMKKCLSCMYEFVFSCCGLCDRVLKCGEVVCCTSFMQHLAVFCIPLVSFFVGLGVYYPGNWTPGNTIDSMNFFRAVIVIGIVVLTVRTATRMWVVETRISECKEEDQVRYRCWWLSQLSWLLSMVALLWLECGTDKDTWASHREPTWTPSEAAYYSTTILMIVAMILTIWFEWVGWKENSAYAVAGLIHFIVMVFYFWMFWDISSDYYNQYAELTQCTDPEAFSTCKCDDCALTAWIFNTLNSYQPEASRDPNYQPNLNICYSNGYNSMTLGEYCKMRDDFPLLLSSYLMVYACIQLVFQITQVFDIANDITNELGVDDRKRQQLNIIDAAQATKAKRDAEKEADMNIPVALPDALADALPVALPAASMGEQLPKRDAYSIAGQDSLINSEETVLLPGLDST
jgi:hypothetical protein